MTETEIADLERKFEQARRRLGGEPDPKAAEALNNFRDELREMQEIAPTMLGGRLFQRVSDLIDLKGQMESLGLDVSDMASSSSRLDSTVQLTLSRLQSSISDVVSRLDLEIRASEQERSEQREQRAREAKTLGKIDAFLDRWV